MKRVKNVFSRFRPAGSLLTSNADPSVDVDHTCNGVNCRRIMESLRHKKNLWKLTRIQRHGKVHPVDRDSYHRSFAEYDRVKRAVISKVMLQVHTACMPAGADVAPLAWLRMRQGPCLS